MSRGRRGLPDILLRGGAVGRRIRVRSILLNSSRGSSVRYDDWLRLEIAKGFVPALLLALVDYLGGPIPLAFSVAVIVGAMGWVAFVLWQAGAAAFRLNARHAAYMKRIGIDLSLRSTLGNPKLWRRLGTSMTMREALAAMRASQAPR